MNVPRGNVLLKPTILNPEDLKLKISNLQHNSFNGYVKVEKETGSHYYIFLLEGLIRSIVEFSGKTASFITDLIFYHRVQAPSKVSSYVLAPELVSVLSGAHAFQEKYLSYQVRKKEFRKVLSTLDSERTTGMLEIVLSSPDDSLYLVFNQGRVVTDNFLDIYGQIVTGPAKVSELIESFSDQGGVVNIYGEKLEEIERRQKAVEEDLRLYRQMEVVIESGGLRLGGGNTVRVDESILKEWGSRGVVQKVEVYVDEAKFEVCKVSGKKGLGNKIAILPGVQKKLGIVKDDFVLVKPILGS
jgi:hypothetical protein